MQLRTLLYLSYESQSNNYVYFDDFKVTVIPTNVVQYNEYYPFGLQTADSWTRDNNSNAFLYNAGNELNSTTQWYEMYYRGYDPALGRMLQVDPYARSFASTTPYNYGLNSPGVINDPSGGYANTNRPEWNAAYWANVAWQQANYTWYDWGYMMGDTQAGGGGGGHGRSARSFISRALGSRYGGSWSNGYGYLFESDEEAYEAFDRYSEYHGSWGNTIYKTRDAYRAAFLMNLALNAPINLANTLACTNCDQIDVLGLTQEDPLKVWYTYTHLNNIDIVRQHTLERKANKEITTVKVAVVLYTKGVLGTDHEIISYGSRTKTYFLDNLEFNKKILATPMYDTFLGEVYIDNDFYNKIYGMVNEHLDCDCYMVLAPKYQTGAPHR